MLKPKFFLLFLLVNMGLELSAQTTVVDSILHGGIYRTYRLYVPAVYTGTQPVPLVLNLHGYTSNADQQQVYGNFMPVADTANFLIVHPNGTEISGARFWNAGLMASPDDVGFLSALIDTLSAQYNIDAQRVYSTGMSNGGIMSYYLACGLYNRIAAIGSVTGSMTVPMYASCNPPGPMPVIEIHGTADGTVPYNGNSSFKHIDSVIKFWSQQNLTAISPVVTSYPNTAAGDGCTATEYAYTNGTGGSQVVLVKVNGGGHTWPGAPIDIGVTNHDFDASVRIWQFFRQFKKSQFTGIHQPEQNDSPLYLYPNPAGQQLRVRGLTVGDQIRVYNAQGVLVLSVEASGNPASFSVTSLRPGIYTLKAGNKTLRFVKR